MDRATPGFQAKNAAAPTAAVTGTTKDDAGTATGPRPIRRRPEVLRSEVMQCRLRDLRPRYTTGIPSARVVPRRFRRLAATGLDDLGLPAAGDEMELLTRLREREERAFDALVRRHHRTMFAVARM